MKKPKGNAMKKKSIGLEFVWNIRLKLWAEGNKLRAEGDKLWAEGILEVYGNIKLEWKNYSSEKQDSECHLETGEVFRP